jgi:hypothetical protein
MFKCLKMNLIFKKIEWIINGDNNNEINDFFNLIIFTNFYFYSTSSIRKFNHVLAVSHIWK